MNASARTLLIVEDEIDIREILVSFLEPLNLNILQAGNGKAALEIIEDKKNTIHAIFTDISMPEMTGLQLLGELKQNYDEIPIVMVSALGDRESLLEALRLGATDFIEKPFKDEQVLAVARRVLEIGESQKVLNKIAHQLADDPMSNVSRIFDMQKEKRKIAILTKKNNQEGKRRSKG